MNEDEKFWNDLLESVKKSCGSDYPIRDEEGGIYFPPRHTCQRCYKILDATDLLDYICMKCLHTK